MKGLASPLDHRFKHSILRAKTIDVLRTLLHLIIESLLPGLLIPGFYQLANLPLLTGHSTGRSDIYVGHDNQIYKVIVLS